MKFSDAVQIVHPEIAVKPKKTGKFHEVTSADEQLVVSYEIIDESFSHAFGIEKTVNHEITDIQLYVPSIKKWVDVSDMSDFQEPALELLRKAISNE
jgi:hypothetical protein